MPTTNTLMVWVSPMSRKLGEKKSRNENLKHKNAQPKQLQKPLSQPTDGGLCSQGDMWWQKLLQMHTTSIARSSNCLDFFFVSLPLWTPRTDYASPLVRGSMAKSDWRNKKALTRE